MKRRQICIIGIIICIGLLSCEKSSDIMDKNEASNTADTIVVDENVYVTVSPTPIVSTITSTPPTSLDKPINFQSSALENIVRECINKTSGDIYLSDIETITELNLVNGGFTGVDDLEDLNYFKNLESLDLDYYVEDSGFNEITDISFLKGLDKLKKLSLNSNKIKDISPLENLTNLEELYLAGNELNDISALKNLTNLVILDLGYNDMISDISVLKNLTKLEKLDISDIKTKDLSSISNLSLLTEFTACFCWIVDIDGIKNCTNMEDIDLSNNMISDIKALSQLKNLHSINLESNDIKDLSPLDDLTLIEDIYVDDNRDIENGQNGTADAAHYENELSNALGNDPNNTVYGGHIASDNTSYYFAKEDSENSILLRMDKATLDVEKLSDACIHDINVSEDYLYYYKIDEETFSFGIYRINKDGTNEIKLRKGIFSSLMLIGDDLYFTDYEPEKLYRMHSDGTGYEVFLEDDCWKFLYNNGYIYTTQFAKDSYSEFSIIRYNVVSKEKEVLVPSLKYSVSDYKFVIPFFVSGSKLYYLPSEGGVVSMNLDGSEMRTIIDENVLSMAVSVNHIIYYTTYADGKYKINSCDFDGNVIKVIKEDLTFNHNLEGIADDYIFFNYKDGEDNKVGMVKSDGTEYEIFN